MLPQKNGDALLDAAISYADQGLHVVPISLSSKLPLVKWAEMPKPDADVIESWFGDGVTTPNGTVVNVFNIGVLTGRRSGIYVVDADTTELASALREAGIVSPLTVKTRRGEHLWFAADPATSDTFGNNALGNIPKLDFRGDGGLVVAPPSVWLDDNGAVAGAYRFTSEGVVSFDELINDLPIFNNLYISKLLNVAKEIIKVKEDHTSIDNMGSHSKSYYHPYGVVSASKVITHDFNDKGVSMITSLPDLSKEVVINDTTTEGRLRATVVNNGPIKEGQGRNKWLTMLAGELVGCGLWGSELREHLSEIQNTYFDPPLGAAELEKVAASIEARERRRNPARFDSEGKPKATTTALDGSTVVAKPKLTLLRPADIAARAAEMKANVPLIDPWLQPASIVQIYGFNGHGKSLFTLNNLWLAAGGTSLGSFECTRPVKVLYCDWENSIPILNARMQQLVESYGDVGENFAVYSPTAGDRYLNLRDKADVVSFVEAVAEFKPDVLVLDTVRSAFAGMDENSPRDWAHVNRIAKALRNDVGCAVVVLHHANKPNMAEGMALGSESGSGAQLTDIDTQVRIALCVEDRETGRARRALAGGAATPDEVGSATEKNHIDGAFALLRRQLETPDDLLKVVFQVSYGKLRQPTENHGTAYVGMVERPDGTLYMLTTDLPKTRVRKLAALGLSPSEINKFLSEVGMSHVLPDGRVIFNTQRSIVSYQSIRDWSEGATATTEEGE